MLEKNSKAIKIARVSLGLAFALFGLNYFVGFMPTPPPTEAGGAFLGALAATGYMFPLIKLTELTAGILLIANRWTPLALVVLAPVVLHIVAYHLVLDPGSTGLPIVLASLGVVVAWGYRDAFRPLFERTTGPARALPPPLHDVTAPSHG